MKLLIAALLAVFSTGAIAEWTYLTSLEDKSFDFYIDKTTIRKKGNVAKMWEMNDSKQLQTSPNGKNYQSKRSLLEIDCAEMRWRGLTQTHFSGNMLEGDITQDFKATTVDWIDIAPNTIAMLWWKTACNK